MSVAKKRAKRVFTPLVLLFLAALSAKNAFANNYVYGFSNEKTLIGKGSYDSPYIVGSYDDLRALRDNVDSGKSFEGKWFRQTADIVFPNDEKWNPIGSVNDECLFKGVYDGNGHTISNIYCEAKNAALFENLYGEIRNLGIESGKFVGDSAASFASFGSAKIINCYNKASVIGNDAAGIASNLSGGAVYYCWNLGKIEAKKEVSHASGIASGFLDIRFSCSVGKLVDFDVFTGGISDSCVITKETIAKTLENEYIALCKNSFGLFSSLEECGAIPVYKNNSFKFVKDGAFILFEAKKKAESDDFLLRKKYRTVFEGKGTWSNPYKIQSYKDLCLLRDIVAVGCLYDGCYFEQTADVVFPEGEFWKPIGDVYKGLSFKGKYDGKKHRIINIQCLDQFAGLFALLDGSVENLIIESGLFYGHTVGSVTSHGGSNMKIINCVNKASVIGVLRAGGITDNASGLIQNCANYGWVSGTKADTVLAGITSYGTPKIIDCVSNIEVLLAKPKPSEPRANDFGISKKRYCLMAAVFFFVFFLTYYFKRKYYGNLFEQKKNWLFAVCFFSLTLFAIIVLFFGDTYMLYFHQDPRDSFMDLFHCIFANQTRGGEIGNYPPASLLPYKVIARMVPFYKGIDSAFALRTSIYGCVILLFHIMFFVLSFAFIVFFVIRGSVVERVLLTFCFLFSGVTLFALERGNIIVYAFLFALLFLLFYDSNNAKLRHLSYVFLALAASLKLYPAVFGLLLLSRRDFKGSIVCFFEFVALYIVCFFLCGLSFGTNNASEIARFASRYANEAWGLNFSVNNFLLLMSEILSSLIKKDVGLNSLFAFVCKLLVFAAGIFTSLCSKEKWKKVAALSLLCIFIPDVSFLYVLLFLFPALIFFLNKSTEDRFDSIYAIMFASIISIVIIPFQFGKGVYSITGGFLLQSCLLLLFALLLFVQAVANCFKKKPSAEGGSDSTCH